MHTHPPPLDAHFLGEFNPQSLAFLRSILRCGNQPVRKTQSAVLKALLDPARADILVLYNTSKAKFDERKKLMLAYHMAPQIIDFHIGLLEILTMCATGRNYLCEAKCQSLLSIKVMLL